MKKVAVVLSGCGFKDGTEITESVSTLIALGQAGAKYSCFAPDKNFESVDHITDESTGSRNTFSESSRICRGQLNKLNDLNPDHFDAIVFPGGYGAALHLCDWAQKGAESQVHPEVVRIIREFHDQSKPIGAICIAPALVAKVLGDKEVTVTIGSDKETAEEIEKTGAVHETCEVTDYITDRANKVVTTPAYMYDDARACEVFTGVNGLVKELVEMA